jgi:predicted DNA-binding protein
MYTKKRMEIMMTKAENKKVPESRSITFRASQHLYQELEMMSKETGVTVSSLVKMCTTQALPKVVKNIFETYRKNSERMSEGLNDQAKKKIHKSLPTTKATS